MKITVTPFLLVGALAAQVSLTLISAVAAELAGQAQSASSISDGVHNWVWSNPARNGNAARENVLNVRILGSTVTGKISAPNREGTPTDTPILAASIAGDTLSFDAVRQFNGNTNTNHYIGRVSAGELIGKIEFTRNGKVQSRDWTAKNAGDRTEAAAVPPPKPGYDEAGYKIVNETKYKLVTVPEAEKYLADHPDAVILDLRPPDNYATGHIPNAKNYDVTDDVHYTEVLAPLDKTKWYLLHSVVGHFRTVRAFEYFEKNGFEHVIGIDGGFQAWVTAGKPVEK